MPNKFTTKAYRSHIGEEYTELYRLRHGWNPTYQSGGHVPMFWRLYNRQPGTSMHVFSGGNNSK